MTPVPGRFLRLRSLGRLRHRPCRHQRRPRLIAAGVLVPPIAVAVLGAGSAVAGSEAGARATGCMPMAAQGGLVVLMLILSCAVHALVTTVQAELSGRAWIERWCGPSSARRFLLIIAVALLTGLALLVEILLWAGLYQALGLFSSLEDCLYFSGITFTTVGYGDMTLPACFRLLSVGEALNGVLMAGWSTAQLITVVQRMMELRIQREGRHPQR